MVTYVIISITIIIYPHLCRLSLWTKYTYKATKAEHIFYTKEYLKINSEILIVAIIAF